MGKVAKQSILSSISAYLGVAVGYLNIVIFMPKYFSPEEIGLFRTIIAIAMLLVPFAFFGSGAAVIKFTPKFKGNTSRLLGFLLVVIHVAFIIVFSLSYVFRDLLFSLFEERAARVNDYFYLVYGLLYLMVIYNFFNAISKSNYSILLPSFMTDFVYKSFHTLVIILVGIGVLSFHEYLLSHFYIYIILCVILAWAVIKSFNVSFSFKGIFQKRFFKDILDFISFSFLGSFGIILVFQIDQIMVSQMLGLEDNGIYTTALFIGLVIEIPRKYVAQIMQPYIADDLHNEDHKKINYGYSQASNILMWIGGLLFITITLNLSNIYAIMPNGERYLAGFWVVYIVGATKLTGMIFSLNGEIISISKYYRINVILIVFLGIATIVTNRIFIPIYGMEGAALASLITLFVFNFIKFLILKINFGLSPFSLKSPVIFLFLVISYFIISTIPQLADPWLDLFVRCAAIGTLSILSIYLIRPSEEIVRFISLILDRFRNEKTNR